MAWIILLLLAGSTAGIVICIRRGNRQWEAAMAPRKDLFDLVERAAERYWHPLCEQTLLEASWSQVMFLHPDEAGRLATLVRSFCDVTRLPGYDPGWNDYDIVTAIIASGMASKQAVAEEKRRTKRRLSTSS